MRATWRFSARPYPVTWAFTVAGGKAETRSPASAPAEEHHAPHVPQDEGAPGVDRVEDVLHGQDVGAQADDQAGDLLVDAAQAPGQVEAGRGTTVPISRRRWRRPSLWMAP